MCIRDRNFGRALLIAGSQGMAGASVLAARACLRSGVGLSLIHICTKDKMQFDIPAHGVVLLKLTPKQ